jgi:hypothetical protein
VGRFVPLQAGYNTCGGLTSILFTALTAFSLSSETQSFKQNIFLLTARQLRGPIRQLAEKSLPAGLHITRRNPPVDCPDCESASWRIPVGRRVWRGICPSERRQPGGQSRVRRAPSERSESGGWFCDRGI